MTTLRLLYHLALADFLERARRYSFLITLGLTIFAAYMYVPPKEADYLTLGLGNYRGVYNSAWIGCAVAVLSSALLSLPAFYLVKNAIERDERTGVGQIIATTPLTKLQYTLGKTLSNLIFLSAMIGVIIVATAAMQILRAEVLAVNLGALMSPFIIVVLPSMAMIAALAILFESIGWLRSTLGNVALCYGWIDGQKKSYNDSFWLQKFTPRGPGSIWSKINREKAEQLIAQGKMKPAGLKAIEFAKQNGRWNAAYDSQKTISIPGDFQAELDKSAEAKNFFSTLNSVNRYAILHRIQTAKKPETRAKRIRQFIALLKKNEKLYP